MDQNSQLKNMNDTRKNNPGYDLYKEDEFGKVTRWIEVKSMTGSLATEDVTMSKAQLECAIKNRENYWLYVVEFAQDPNKIEIRKIQDPWGKLQYLRIDDSWLEEIEKP